MRYEFSNLEDFALGEYNLFSQALGNPTFSFAVPYYGFYVQDSFRTLSALTLEMGLREDSQVLTAKGFAHGRNARCGKICLISEESPNPMPPTSAQADTARIHGIGWLWQSSRALRGDHRH